MYPPLSLILGVKSHFVYILECSDGSLYTGYTTDPERRLRKHNSGRGAKYTRAKRPVRLIFKKGFSNRAEALRYEFKVKKASRSAKLLLSRGELPKP